jgi:endonuclease/exonuclease/phosphatase family metal-dependent hydrolase
MTGDGIALTSFNVHWGGRTPGGRTTYDLGAVSRSLPGDVVVYQEDWDHPDEPSRIEVPPGWHQYRHVFGRLERPRSFGLPPPLAARRGEWGLLVASAHPLELAGRVSLPAVFGDNRTSAPVLRIASPAGDLTVVAVHLASTAVPFGALRQLPALHRQVPAGPVVVLGDHNLWATWTRPFFAGFTRAVRGPTWPARRPWSQIDHIWVRGLEVAGGRALRFVGSDHRPVTATVR